MASSNVLVLVKIHGNFANLSSEVANGWRTIVATADLKMDRGTGPGAAWTVSHGTSSCPAAETLALGIAPGDWAGAPPVVMGFRVAVGEGGLRGGVRLLASPGPPGKMHVEEVRIAGAPARSNLGPICLPAVEPGVQPPAGIMNFDLPIGKKERRPLLLKFVFRVNFKEPAADPVAVGGRAAVVDSVRAALSDPALHDFVLTCGGRDFPCSRFVLAARSPVFKAMILEHKNTKEAMEGAAEIKDASPGALEAFLNLLYAGDASDLSPLTG